MTYVALAALALNALTVLGFLHLIARSARAHARREDLMLNQMLNLAGRPWQPPPSFEAPDFGPEPDEAFEDVDQVLP